MMDKILSSINKMTVIGIIVFFYLLTPVCFFGFYNTSASLKYEVDEALIFLDIHDNYSVNLKMKRIQEIEKHEKELKQDMNFCIAGFIVFPAIASALIINRKRLQK